VIFKERRGPERGGMKSWEEGEKEEHDSGGGLKHRAKAQCKRKTTRNGAESMLESVNFESKSNFSGNNLVRDY